MLSTDALTRVRVDNRRLFVNSVRGTGEIVKLNRARVGIVVLATTGITLTGCSGAGESAVEYRADGLLHCGYEKMMGGDGETFDHEIIFSYRELETSIESSSLAEQLGFAQVQTCEQARAATAALEEVAAREPEDADLGVYPGETEAGEKIASGTGYAYTPALEISISGNGGISTCTGTLINKRVAITSAHCVDHVLNPSNTDHETKKNVSVQLSLFRPLPTPPTGGGFNDVLARAMYEISGGGTWTCPSWAGADGKCQFWGKANVTMHGAFTGSANASNDIAIIWLDSGSQFAGVTTSDLQRVYSGSLDKVGIVSQTGRGPNKNDNTNAGRMRVGYFLVDSFSSTSLTSEVRSTTVCEGDSGGPTAVYQCLASNLASCGNHVVGLLSNGTLSSNRQEVCAPVGGSIHSTRLGGGASSKLAWIREQTGITCSKLTGTLGTYERCF
jgi:hypothetical protein